jgi:hypothetical protein
MRWSHEGAIDSQETLTFFPQMGLELGFTPLYPLQ